MMNKKLSIKYRAVDKDGNLFCNAYGKDANLPYVADSYLDVSHYVAYYWKRCYAKLQVCKDGNKWEDASEFDQKLFQKRLDADFFFQETK